MGCAATDLGRRRGPPHATTAVQAATKAAEKVGGRGRRGTGHGGVRHSRDGTRSDPGGTSLPPQ